MIEAEALQNRRSLLLESIGKAADEIASIDAKIEELMNGKKPGAGEA